MKYRNPETGQIAEWNGSEWKISEPVRRARNPETGETAELRDGQWKITKPQEQGVGGFMRGLRDPLDAGAQMLEKALPEGVVSGVNRFNDWLVDQGIPLKRMGKEGLQGQLNELESGYQKRRVAEGEVPGSVDWSRLGGNLAGGLAGGGMTRLVGRIAPVTTAGRIGAGLGGGAVGGSLSEPVANTDDFWKQKAKQAATGAAFGGILSGGGEALGGLGRRAGSRDVRALQEAGVDPTVGQALGGIADRVEQKAASIPFAGDMITAARRGTHEQFDMAAINDALKPIGARVDKAGHAGISKAQDAVSDAYERAASVTKGVPIDAGFRQNLQTIRTEGTVHLDEDTAKNFERFVSGVIDKKLGDAPGLTRESFEEVDKAINKKIRDTKTFEAREIFQGLRDMLLDQAEKANPEYADLYKRARTAAAKLMRVERASMAAPTQEGIFTPGQLAAASKAMDTSSRKRQIAGGEGLMQNLAERGQRVLGNTVPNSGTTDRALMTAGAGFMLDPIVGSSLLGLTGAYTRPAQKALLKTMQSGQRLKGGPAQGLGAGILGGGYEY